MNKWTLIALSFLAGVLLYGQNQNANLNPRQLALQQAYNSPIDFWGKVVDQNGKPVAGATVTFLINDHFSFEDEKPKLSVLSDAGGLFSLTGKKGLGIIMSISKEGYSLTWAPSGVDLNYFRKASEHVTTFRMEGKDVPFPTQDRPTVFVLSKN